MNNLSLRFILFFGIILFSFGLKAQKNIEDIRVNAMYNQETVQEILVSISKKYNVNISFDPALLANIPKKSIQIRNEKLTDVLDVLLDDTPAEYTIRANQIIVVPKPPKEKDFKMSTKEISGYIEDSNTGERLPFAYIYTPDGSLSVSTNEYGYYNFKVPVSVNQLKISYLGYKDTLINVSDLAGNKFNIDLTTNTELEEVVITEDRKQDLVDDYDIFVRNDLKKMRRMQSFGGSMDVVRFLTTLPGVSTGADGLGGYSVRGSNVSHNLILLDGIPVYNSTHGLGVFSIFDESAIKNANFYRAHIPARYGGRLSSVLDIRTREGSLEKYGGSFSLGLLLANGYLEGPILKDKLSFVISGRRTLFEPYIGPISQTVKRAQGGDGRNDYFFGDFNMKIQGVINEKNRIYLSYYTGRDAFTDLTETSSTFEEFTSKTSDAYDWSWGNRLIGLRWSSQLGSDLFSNVSLYNSSYNFEAFNQNNISQDSSLTEIFYRSDASLYQTAINDLGVRWDLDYYQNARSRWRIGAHIVNHNFLPGLVNKTITDSSISGDEIREEIKSELGENARIAREYEMYLSNVYRTTRFISDIGIRASIVQAAQRNYFSLQPRISLKYALTNQVFLKASGNITNQYLHLLASSRLGLPTDIWIPSTPDIEPERAYQLTGGVDFKLADALVFSNEFFFKRLFNVLSLKEGAVFSVIEDSNWEADIPVGEGTAYGWETSIVGEYGKHNMNLNYTWSRSNRLFEKINSGKTFPSQFDRRHQMNLAYQYQINKNISVNAQFVLATGHPQTLPTLIQNNELIYTIKNNQRLPVYDRLDLSFQIENDFSWGAQRIILGLYNVYNKQNPYYFFLQFEENDPSSFQIKQVTVFPILPNVSYSLHF